MGEERRKREGEGEGEGERCGECRRDESWAREREGEGEGEGEGWSSTHRSSTAMLTNTPW